MNRGRDCFAALRSARNDAGWSSMNSSDIDDDPHLWLEEIDSPQVREWIAARNAETVGALCDGRFEADREAALAILDADDRIPGIGRLGAYVYNFWKDGAHPKGLWRRTTLADYRRGLVQLSRGGSDATAIREFDLDAKRFVADGFSLPESKAWASWIDEDRVLVGSPLGGDDFATESGYARTLRLWRRGTLFVEAPIVFEGERSHVWVYGARAHEVPHPRTFFVRALDFINNEV